MVARRAGAEMVPRVAYAEQWLDVEILVGNGSQSNSFISGSQSMFSSLLRSAVNLDNIMCRRSLVHNIMT